MKRPYRTLHVIDHLGTGGAQEVVCQLVKYSQRGVCQPEVLTLFGHGYYYEILRSWGIPVYSLIPDGLKYKIYGQLQAHILTKIFLFLTQNRYEVVHAHLLWSMMYFTPMAALFKVPIRINHDHALEVDRYRKHRTKRLLSNRLAHHIIAVSLSIKTFLCQEEKVPAHKITVINNGVDLSRFSQESDANVQERARRKWNLPADALIIGGVGRLGYQKNFSLFLEVAAKVYAQVPQAFFVIAGDGPDQASLREKSRELGIASRVRFLGFIKEMSEFYQSLDLLLLTSHYEGTPLTVLEAMAMGLPVVASHVDGVGDVLVDGKDAILVPPGRRDLFVKGICQLLQDRKLWQQFSRAGREKVRQCYSAEAMTRQVEAIYLKCLGGGRMALIN